MDSFRVSVVGSIMVCTWWFFVWTWIGATSEESGQQLEQVCQDIQGTGSSDVDAILSVPGGGENEFNRHLQWQNDSAALITMAREISAVHPLEGDICIFLPGYLQLLQETRLSVASISTFMPGVRVVIATLPVYYNIFNGALAKFSTLVSIVNSTRVDYASLSADQACGEDIRLIFYMNPGDMLSRPFTADDTHSLQGDLLVKYTYVEHTDRDYHRRSMGTASLLGFHGYSFTHDSNLLLPAELNSQLREVLRTTIDESGSKTNITNMEYPERHAFHGLLDSIMSNYTADISIFIPELLASLLFMQNPSGIHFFHQMDQDRHFPLEATIIHQIKHGF